MTLIETLVSLALLSAVAVACMGWTSTAARLGSGPHRDAAWRLEAERALALIDEDLLRTGDSQAAVHVRDDVLVTPTRRLVSGRRGMRVVTTARYKVDDEHLVVEWLDEDGDLASTRFLVAARALELVREQPTEGAPEWVRVRLVEMGGASVERAFPVREENVR